jgi:hypothetical protein
MDKAQVRDYLVEFQRASLPAAVPRELTPRGRIGLIHSILGPRRAGKTYLLYQMMRGLPRPEVLYLNFEDTRLLSVRFDEVLDVLRLHEEMFGREPRHLFLDEPQNLPQWERAVRTCFDRRTLAIVLTGSSSRLLGREIATALRGRAVSHLLLPYSFREYLRSRGIGVPSPPSASDEARLRNALSQFLAWGGYPEVVGSADETERMKILDSYRELIVYRDVIDRYRPRSPFAMKLLIDLLLASSAREFSVHGWYGLLKSRNIAVSKNTLYNYLSQFEDSLAAFVLERWSPKLKERRLAPKKAYLCDTGLAYRQREDRGRQMENAVFLELMRLQDQAPDLELAYWRDHRQREVDFVVRRGARVTALVQVTMAADRREVPEREADNLLAASKELGCRKLVVVTWDHEGEERTGGRTVRFVPLWRWLLATDSAQASPRSK